MRTSTERNTGNGETQDKDVNRQEDGKNAHGDKDTDIEDEEGMKTTSGQRMIAERFGIPSRLAHTVNTALVPEFLKWWNKPENKLERWLDRQAHLNMVIQQREWLGGRRDVG